jgi:hypothetical protein
VCHAQATIVRESLTLCFSAMGFMLSGSYLSFLAFLDSSFFCCCGAARFLFCGHNNPRPTQPHGTTTLRTHQHIRAPP